MDDQKKKKRKRKRRRKRSGSEITVQEEMQLGILESWFHPEQLTGCTPAERYFVRLLHEALCMSAAERSATTACRWVRRRSASRPPFEDGGRD